MHFKWLFQATPWVAALLTSQVGAEALSSHKSCKCFPGDACWPTAVEWSAFNKTVDGRLIATVPFGDVCHDSFDGKPTYNESACANLQAHWVDYRLHIATSYSGAEPYFSNRSCDPFLGKDTPCVVGTYLPYAVNATTNEHIVKTMEFARKRNIRFVIRNTGHDFLGRSTGPGALALWTHHMKGVELSEYKSDRYSGKAMKIAAGVLGEEAADVARSAGLVVVGGNCESVGIAGGYTQGGGYSPLTSRFGLAPDQVLEWEVVLASGKCITATPDQNSDLYWALAGGGGGTYGVVTSMTVRTYHDAPTSTASLNWTLASAGSKEAFWEGVESFQTYITALNDIGAHALATYTNASFSLSHTLGHGVTPAQLNETLQPFRTKLTSLGINYTYGVWQFPTYVEALKFTNPPEQGAELFQQGGWLVPRTVLNERSPALTKIFRGWAEDGILVAVFGANASRKADSIADNAALPAWRNAGINAQPLVFYSHTDEALNVENRRLIREEYIPALQNLAPESGAYMNEANWQQPNFQQAFYGDNYQRLLSIKHKYDPHGFFYAQTAVGSERWQVEGDGRMCLAK